MQEVPRRADGFLHYPKVAFVLSDQVAATHGRHLLCKPKRLANMVVHRNPTGSRCPSTAAFRAILNVNP